jgi:hypothetical protein
MESLVIALVACVIATFTIMATLFVTDERLENVMCAIWCFWRFITGRRV